MANQYKINQTVGKFAKNDPEEVKATKHVLNRIMGTSFDEDDGSYSEEFYKAILALQVKYVPKGANGRIDPWGATVNKINELLPKFPPKPKLVLRSATTTREAKSGGTIAKITIKPMSASASAGARLKGKTLWDRISPGVPEEEIKAILESFRKRLLAVIARCLPHRTDWKLETTANLSAGLGVFGAQAGKIIVKHTVTGETKDLFLFSAGGGKSILPANVNFSTTDFPGTGLGNLYRGPNRKSEFKPGDLDGIFFEATINIAPPDDVNTSGSLADAANTVGLSLYFFGLSTALLAMSTTTRDLRTILDLIDNCSAMGIMWGTAIGFPDANVGIQLGKAAIAGSVSEGVKRLVLPWEAVNL